MVAAETITIDCATCVARESGACADCVVTAVLTPAPAPAPLPILRIAPDEQDALREFQQAGLLPQLRYEPR